MSERDETSFTDEVVDGVLRGDRGLRSIQPGEPGYDDEHGDQGKQEDRLADAERGRAFLEQLRDRRLGDDWDIAYLALDDVVHGCDPKDLTEQATAALGRVLRGSA